MTEYDPTKFAADEMANHVAWIAGLKVGDRMECRSDPDGEGGIGEGYLHGWRAAVFKGHDHEPGFVDAQADDVGCEFLYRFDQIRPVQRDAKPVYVPVDLRVDVPTIATRDDAERHFGKGSPWVDIAGAATKITDGAAYISDGSSWQPTPAREVGTDHPQKCDCCKSSAVVSTGADDLCADCAATYITRLRQMNADKNAKIERLENPLIDVRYDGDRVESVCVGGLLYVPAGDENTVGSPANLARSNERLKRYAKAAIDDEYESGVKYRAIIAELTAKLTEEKRISAGLQALYVEATEAKAPKVERGAGLLTSWAPGKTGRQ